MPQEPIEGDVLYLQRLHDHEGVTDIVDLAASLVVRVSEHIRSTTATSARARPAVGAPTESFEERYPT